MKTKFISIFAIIFGLIIIIFPIMGLIKTSALIGLSLLLISIYLLVVGVAIIDYNKRGAILDLILGGSYYCLFAYCFLYFEYHY